MWGLGVWNLEGQKLRFTKHVLRSWHSNQKSGCAELGNYDKKDQPPLERTATCLDSASEVVTRKVYLSGKPLEGPPGKNDVISGCKKLTKTIHMRLPM